MTSNEQVLASQIAVLESELHRAKEQHEELWSIVIDARKDNLRLRDALVEIRSIAFSRLEFDYADVANKALLHAQGDK